MIESKKLEGLSRYGILLQLLKNKNQQFVKSQYSELVITWSEKTPVNNSLDTLKNRDSLPAKVLYQIYGDHHIYGRDTLLYIGITKNADARFYTHLKGVFGYVNALTISFGILKDFDTEKFTVPESILIANHKPSYNKEFLHDLATEAKKEKIIVINNGNNYMLKTCCTNYWWVN